MSEPDDAAWIAAAGAPRLDDGSAAGYAAAAPVIESTEDQHFQRIQPVSDGSNAEQGSLRQAVPEQPMGQPAPDSSSAAGLWATPEPASMDVPPAPQSNPGLAGSSSPALRAMRGRDPEPAPLSSHGPATVIAMCNQKGGVGKTTSTINLGAALAEYGRRVLLVDLDPQGALSAGLGIASDPLEFTIYNLMLSSGTAITDVLMPTGIEGVDLIPANIDLSAGEVQLINEVAREQTLARALRPVLHAYDYVLIDCQPSLGLLTLNALACANGVIIPLAAEYFSLRGVASLMKIVGHVQERINPDLSLEGVLITMYDGRTVHAREVVGMLHQRFGDTVFDTVIPRTVKFPDTTSAGEPITSYAPTSAAAQSYRALAREVIAR
jgi:chromosome partitioning protein